MELDAGWLKTKQQGTRADGKGRREDGPGSRIGMSSGRCEQAGRCNLQVVGERGGLGWSCMPDGWSEKAERCWQGIGVVPGDVITAQRSGLNWASSKRGFRKDLLPGASASADVRFCSVARCARAARAGNPWRRVLRSRRVRTRASCGRRRADGDRSGAAEPTLLVPERREVGFAGGHQAIGRAAPGVCDLHEASAPERPRQFRQSTARAMRQFLCADWRRDSDARARNFRAKARKPREDNSTVERYGG